VEEGKKVVEGERGEKGVRTRAVRSSESLVKKKKKDTN